MSDTLIGLNLDVISPNINAVLSSVLLFIFFELRRLSISNHVVHRPARHADMDFIFDMERKLRLLRSFF